MNKLWRILGNGHHYWVVGDYTYYLFSLFEYYLTPGRFL